MRFISKLKALFFNEKNVGIINIGDLLQIPGRDYFKGNQIAIDMIDKYKNIYLSILEDKKVITTKQLVIDNMHDDMNMNIELLLNSVCHDNDNFGIVKEKDKYDNIIESIKLRLYLNEINRMELVTIAKIIALKELEKGRRIPRINRSVLNDELNNLMTLIIVFMGQKRAIEIETTTYLRMLNEKESTHLSKKQQMIKRNKEKDEFCKRLKLLFEIAKEYINIDDVLKTHQPDEVKIAIIKRRLEIYVFNHKEEILKLNEELEDIAKTKKTANNKKELLNRLNNLEKKYKIYDIYGKNVVKEEDINNFYRVKFDVLTCDIMSLEYDIQQLKEENPKALQCYKNIIMEKIEDIVMGKNPYIQMIFGDDKLKAIKEIIKSLKSNGKSFDLDKILTDINYLSFLLAFDTVDGINDYFNRRIPRDTWDIDTSYFYENKNRYFTFDNILPISTIFEVLEPRVLKSCFSYGIYSLLKKDINSNEYYLPEGITKINFYGNVTEENDLDYFTRKLRKNGCGKIIVMPNSLTFLSGELYKGLPISGFVLNEGLKKLGSSVLKDRRLNYIVLPSTLESITWGEEPVIDFDKIKDIRFNDYKNSKILNNDLELCKFLYYSSRLHKTYKVAKKELEVKKPYHMKYSSRIDWRGFPLGKEEWHTTYATHIENRYYPQYSIIPILNSITLYEGNMYDSEWVVKYFHIDPKSYQLLDCTSSKFEYSDSDEARKSSVQIEPKDLFDLTEAFLEELNKRTSNSKSRTLIKEPIHRFASAHCKGANSNK